MELITEIGEIKIIRIRTKDDALPYRASFTGAYQTIFSDPPYSERFYPSEAQAVLYQNLQANDSITFLAIKGKRKVVGFSFAVPVKTRPEIAKDLRGLVPIKHSFYLAELGVLESFRHKGLGNALTKLRLEHIDSQRYTHVVLRRSVAYGDAHQLFERLGFEDMGVYTEVSARRTDGSVRTDRRLFLSRLLT